MGAGLSHIPIFFRFIRSVFFVAQLSCCVAAELFIALVSRVYWVCLGNYLLSPQNFVKQLEEKQVILFAGVLCENA